MTECVIPVLYPFRWSAGGYGGNECGGDGGDGGERVCFFIGLWVGREGSDGVCCDKVVGACHCHSWKGDLGGALWLFFTVRVSFRGGWHTARWYDDCYLTGCVR